MSGMVGQVTAERYRELVAEGRSAVEAMGVFPPVPEIIDAIRYLVDSGCKWRSLPADFPPFQTVYGFLERSARTGVFSHQRDQLRRALRIVDRRPRNPVKILTTASRSREPRRFPRPPADTTRVNA